MPEIGLHAPSMMKERVSYNQMEVAVVKQDGYPTVFGFVQIGTKVNVVIPFT